MSEIYKVTKQENLTKTNPFIPSWQADVGDIQEKTDSWFGYWEIRHVHAYLPQEV